MEVAVAYFGRNQDPLQRGAKILADIACAALLFTYAIVFFGFLGGLVAFVILEAALLSVDFLVPNEDDAHSVVR
jgi:hypothetical protein